MTQLQSFAPWINRLVLVAATFVFAAIGLRYIADPVSAAAATGVTITSPLASTTTRIGFGAFPLGLAIFSVSCLFSKARLGTGVALVATVVSTAIAVRLFSLVTDGVAAESVRLFIPEGAILALAVTGLSLESAARRASPSPAA